MIGSSLRFIRSVESCFHLGQFRVEIRFQVQVGESDERRREQILYGNTESLTVSGVMPHPEYCHVHFNFLD